MKTSNYVKIKFFSEREKIRKRVLTKIKMPYYL